MYEKKRERVRLKQFMCMGECVRERKSVRLCQFERVNVSNGTIVQMQAGGGRMWKRVKGHYRVRGILCAKDRMGDGEDLIL